MNNKVGENGTDVATALSVQVSVKDRAQCCPLVVLSNSI